jgi:parallel beta-helix repeat protein
MGIYISYSYRNIFLDTMVTHNGLWWDQAVYIYRSNNNQFVNLTVSDNIGPGIRLRESSNKTPVTMVFISMTSVTTILSLIVILPTTPRRVSI